ncbi:DUF2892 domain-containing protein [uncultured Thiodictyon sp.]|uniref:YgaP family membrane protein n=1 Tax=uncultured Thiodictyon sp. TaxID=1846217 RepID=UPI0025F84FA5|nr:DUF2892 domain-containing protein [uncultured Thiodictyon sp.]
MAFKFKLPELKQPDNANVGKKDRIIRVVVAALLLLGAFRGGIIDHWYIALIALVLLASAYFAFCPAYVPIGKNTAQDEPPAKQ